MATNPSNQYWCVLFFSSRLFLETQQIKMDYNLDILLILEHSFHLFHQKDSQPLLSAAQKYKASNIPKKVKLAMKGVFDQYKKASKEAKVKMIMNVILQNRISMFSMSFFESNNPPLSDLNSWSNMEVRISSCFEEEL
jgi:hypothetical protein